MKTANLVRFAQCAALALLIACSINAAAAQTPQPPGKGASSAVTKPAPVDPPNFTTALSSKLTDAELAELVKLAGQQRDAANALQAKINAVLTLSCEGCDKDALLLAAAKAANEFFNANVKPLGQQIDARIVELQKAHGCEGCKLENGAFVRPAKEGAKQ